MFAQGADASVIIRFPFRENFARTIAFSVVFVLLSVFFCVFFVLKGTLVSCVKRNDGFGVSIGCEDPFHQSWLPQSLQVTAHSSPSESWQLSSLSLFPKK